MRLFAELVVHLEEEPHIGAEDFAWLYHCHHHIVDADRGATEAGVETRVIVGSVGFVTEDRYTSCWHCV